MLFLFAMIALFLVAGSVVWFDAHQDSNGKLGAFNFVFAAIMVAIVIIFLVFGGVISLIWLLPVVLLFLGFMVATLD